MHASKVHKIFSIYSFCRLLNKRCVLVHCYTSAQCLGEMLWNRPTYFLSLGKCCVCLDLMFGKTRSWCVWKKCYSFVFWLRKCRLFPVALVTRAVTSRLWLCLDLVETRSASPSLPGTLPSWGSDPYTHMVKFTQKGHCQGPNKNKKKQAQRRAAAGRSRHKSHGVIHTRGCIFPHDAQNEFSLFPLF